MAIFHCYVSSPEGSIITTEASCVFSKIGSCWLRFSQELFVLCLHAHAPCHRWCSNGWSQWEALQHHLPPLAAYPGLALWNHELATIFTMGNPWKSTRNWGIYLYNIIYIYYIIYYIILYICVFYFLGGFWISSKVLRKSHHIFRFEALLRLLWREGTSWGGASRVGTWLPSHI